MQILHTVEVIMQQQAVKDGPDYVWQKNLIKSFAVKLTAGQETGVQVTLKEQKTGEDKEHRNCKAGQLIAIVTQSGKGHVQCSGMNSDNCQGGNYTHYIHIMILSALSQ